MRAPHALMRRGRRMIEEILHPPSEVCPPTGYHLTDPGVAYYCTLSVDPPIFYVGHWMDEDLRFIASMDMLYEYLRHRPAYFLVHWWWNIDDPGRVEYVRRFEVHHRRRYPHHRFVHCCNTVRQQEAFRQQGLETVFLNQNCLVDERIFRPLNSPRRPFDAVYDARFKDYKRHELAAKVEKLALIYDFNTHVDDPDYVQGGINRFPEAHIFNHRNGVAYEKLNKHEVNDCLNQCRVGLCLSAVEGAMYASIQYLLAGLPVVSTRSRGGRDVFFDDDFVRIVEDDPDAVAEGVTDLVRENIPAELVRGRTLEKMMVHRARLISLVQSIYDAESVKKDSAAEWETVFSDNLLKYGGGGGTRHSDTIERLKAASRG